MSKINLNKLVGDNLKRLIKEHGYNSQDKFARDIDTDTSYLNTILNGKRGLGPDVMQRVIDTLRIHPQELFYEPAYTLSESNNISYLAEVKDGILKKGRKTQRQGLRVRDPSSTLNIIKETPSKLPPSSAEIGALKGHKGSFTIKIY